MNDATIASIAVHLAASKNRKYRESIFEIYRVLAFFLQENGLTTRPLLGAGETPSGTFKIVRSDLTEDGLKLVQRGLDKWVNGVVSGQRPVGDTSVMSKELAKLKT